MKFDFCGYGKMLHFWSQSLFLEISFLGEDRGVVFLFEGYWRQADLR